MTTPGTTAGSNIHTFFFREPDALHVTSRRLARRKSRVAVWSAGCSTGDEAHSLAILMAGRDCEIVGSDVRDDALATASAGRYTGRHLRHVEASVAAKYFVRERDHFTVRPEVRALVRFHKHHLRDDAPLVPSAKALWDVIFCRNVLLYYDEDERVRIVRNLVSVLDPHGILVLGASEWLSATTLAKLVNEHPIAAMLEDGVVVYRRGAEHRPHRGSAKVARRPPQAAPAKSVKPMDVAALRKQAELMMDTGDMKSAADTLRAALRIDPLAADIQTRLAFCHLALGDSRAAEKALRRALFLAPALWPAALVLGDMLMTEAPNAARRYLLQAWHVVESGKLDPAAAATAEVAPFVLAEAMALDAVRVRLAWLKAREDEGAPMKRR